MCKLQYSKLILTLILVERVIYNLTSFKWHQKIQTCVCMILTRKLSHFPGRQGWSFPPFYVSFPATANPWSQSPQPPRIPKISHIEHLKECPRICQMPEGYIIKLHNIIHQFWFCYMTWWKYKIINVRNYVRRPAVSGRRSLRVQSLETHAGPHLTFSSNPVTRRCSRTTRFPSRSGGVWDDA